MLLSPGKKVIVSLVLCNLLLICLSCFVILATGYQQLKIII